MTTRLLSPILAGILLFSACSSETYESIDTTVENTAGLVSGSQVGYSINYDPSKWSAIPGAAGEDAEYEFEHVDGDVYALVIAERVELDYETLKEIALENAQSVAPDALIVFEEERTVNEVPLHVLKIDGTLYGIPFEYYGYYYGGPVGTIQFITYTSSNLTSEYEADLTELLNGLTITE
ncbi:MAG: hypothetical protein AAB383_05400 [Patescibacteria group bacterium]